MLLLLLQTKSRTLSPVLKHAVTYGMDSVNGKINSGCLTLKVRNDLFSRGILGKTSKEFVKAMPDGDVANLSLKYIFKK